MNEEERAGMTKKTLMSFVIEMTRKKVTLASSLS